jgi:phage terminase large subunit-like protein
VSRASDIIDFVHEYLLVPEGRDVGQPMRLRDWQQSVVYGIYDENKESARRVIISFGRKNGKSSLTAMLLLANLIGPEARRNAQIYSAAQSRDQPLSCLGLPLAWFA